MKPQVEHLFDHAFCINLDYRVDRWQHAQSQFQEQGLHVQRWPAVSWESIQSYELKTFKHWGRLEKKRKAALACTRSHRAVHQYALEQGYEVTVVFEDDVVFCSNAIECLRCWYTELPEDWDVILLGGNFVDVDGPVEETYSKHFKQFYNAKMAHAVLYRRSFLADLVPVLNQEHRIIDVAWHDVMPNKKCFRVDPQLALQDAMFSDIIQRKVNYARYLGYNFEEWKTLDPRSFHYNDLVFDTTKPHKRNKKEGN